MYLGVSCHSVARFLRALEQNPISLQNHRTFRKINQESQKYNNYLTKMLLIILWLGNCCVRNDANVSKSCKNIWNPLLSSRGPPRTLLPDTTAKTQFLYGKIDHFMIETFPTFAFHPRFSENQQNRPEMARKTTRRKPHVDPKYTQRKAYIAPRWA